jgi:hypothetical protein
MRFHPVDIRSPGLQRLYEDWQRWRGAREFPSRSDFDPLDLKYILGNISVTDVFYGPVRFQYRIHASGCSGRLGFDLTGKNLDALPHPTYQAFIREHFLETIVNRAPSIKRRDRVLGNNEHWFLEAIVLPFSSDGQTIDMLMAGTKFDVPKRLVAEPVANAAQAHSV